MPLFVMVDGSVGTEEVTRIARHPAVVRMVFQPGRGDGGAGGGDRRASLWAARRRVVSASRLGGLEPPLDAMTPARHRWEDVYQHARSTRALGFGGVLCAAPSQIEPVKAAYAPGQRDVDWANEVLAGKGLTAEEQDAADLRYECRKAIAILSNHAKRDQPTSALGPGSGATKRARLFPGSETCGL